MKFRGATDTAGLSRLRRRSGRYRRAQRGAPDLPSARRCAACGLGEPAMTNHLFTGLLPKNRPGDRISVISPDGSTLSYDDVLAKTASYAAAIQAAGVKPGDRVAAQVDKSNEALFLYLGCVRAGAMFLPLNMAYTPA